MPLCNRAQKFAEGLAVLTSRWDDAFIDSVFGTVLRRGGVWEKMLRDIAEFGNPAPAVDGLKKLYRRMNPKNRGNVGRIFFDRDAVVDATLYQYRALDGPGRREQFLNRWLQLENANVRNLNVVANALNGNNTVRGTDFVMDFADRLVPGRFDRIAELEMKSVSGQQGVDLVFKQSVRLPDGSRMRFGEFKSGPSQGINVTQGLNHLEAIVRRAKGNTTGVNQFRFVLNRSPGDSGLPREAFNFLRALVNNAGQGSAHKRRAIDHILGQVRTHTGVDPRTWQGDLIWGALSTEQEEAVQLMLKRFFFAHPVSYPRP